MKYNLYKTHLIKREKTAKELNDIPVSVYYV